MSLSSSVVVGQAFDLLASGHAAYVKDLRDDAYTARIAALLTELLPAPAGMRVLDLGGGSGNWARWLAARGCRVLLTDLSREMLRIAAKEDDKQLLLRAQMDIARPAVAPGQFDVFLAVGDALSYAQDPLAALRALVALARPDQWLIGTVMSRRGVAMRLAAAGSWEEAAAAEKTGVIVERSAGELARLAAERDAVPPGEPLLARLFTADALLTMLQAAGARPQRLVGLNVARCIAPAAPDTAAVGAFADLVCEQPWWRDCSTNLLFAAQF